MMQKMDLPIPAESHTSEVLVLGVGNPIMGDDGVGPRVIELLSTAKLPANVILCDAGLPGWGLPSWWEGKPNVILIDAIQMGQAPGSWKRFQTDEITLELDSDVCTLHKPDLACGLALSQALDMLPANLLIYGIEPADLTLGAPLSLAVESSLPEVIASILQDVEKIIL